MKVPEFSVLVADDDLALVARTIAEIEQLARELRVKLTPFKATSGKEALDIMYAQRPDVAFLDYHFPGGMSGSEVLDNVVGHIDPLNDLAVVFMSNQSETILKGVLTKHRRALGGRFWFLRKDFEPIELRNIFGAALEYLGTRPLPFALAHAIRLADTAPGSYSRVTALKDIVEALVRYLVALLYCDAKANNMDLNALDDRLRRPLTLGVLLDILSRLWEMWETRSWPLFVAEMRCVFQEKWYGPEGHKNLLYQFKDAVRDPLLGHGVTLADGAYAEVFQDCAAPIRRLCSDWACLARYGLVAVQDHEFLGEEVDVVRYRAWLLMGVEATPRTVSFESKKRLTKGKVYLLRSDGNVIGLDPFFVFTTCRECNTDKCFWWDFAGDGAARYTSICNHRTGKRGPVWGRDGNP